MMEIITYKSRIYPKLQTQGFAAQYAFPFAKEILKFCQCGLDVGCSKLMWALPGAIPVDPALDKRYDAMNLPKVDQPIDFIFSSHMLEHYKGSWVEVLDYWRTALADNGIVFLYLPHYSQEYWRSFNNHKHVHNLNAETLRDYFNNGGWKNVMVTDGHDLNNSFYAIAQKE